MDGFIKIIDDTGELLREALPRSDRSILTEWEKKYADGVLKFTDKEISKMPKQIKKEFKAGNIVAHIRKRPNGVYELRCQVQYQKITATSKNLATAKEKFLTALTNLIFDPTPKKKTKKVILCDYMETWLNTVKKPVVKDVTFKDYLQCLNTYIRPTFDNAAISEIKGFELQKFINGFTEKGKHRTAKKIHVLLSAVFDYAIIDDIIQKNPMQKISRPRYEERHGSALTRNEEQTLLTQLYTAGSIYAQTYVFLIYTGLRRSELADAELNGDWITVNTAKQRKGFKEKLRHIPVSPMLRKVLPFINFDEIKMLSPDTITRHIKDYFPQHHVHDMRHTFITRCQECGIQRELVSLWAGHNADTSMTTLVYTHLEQNKEHQIEEMKKFDYSLQ